MRRELEQAARHGTALLAALGLPRLVDAGFIQVDGEALGDALDVVISHLDAIDAPEEDLEPEDELREAGGDDEPSLGALERHEDFVVRIDGRWTVIAADQGRWADSGLDDREDGDDNGIGDHDGLMDQWAAMAGDAHA